MKKKIIEDCLRRFDRYFSRNTSAKNQELRRYIKEYLELIEEYSCAFVPRIFVYQYGSSSLMGTAMVWGFNYRTLFPPTDIILLGSPSYDQENDEVIGGYAKMDDLITKLHPYLDDIDSYVFTKKLSAKYQDFYEHSEKMDDLIEKFPQPIETIFRVKGVDIIPSFEGEEMYGPTTRRIYLQRMLDS
jgi:hypothetical protein